ncbi:peptide ABC transporter permease [Streptomyces spiroverticillatus]|uniref:Transport permease protein n=1 Tax=Streptomyces finlayi TaxID=67296 RepID=A0A919CBA6_9ACTN|nr:ABC transporter permease [Streptomyces finlayi]GHA18105.1 peptide ABC transporter permease [Streptomyces spiroverticillatus]GHC99794.1 peptide ABC transporter permease [Streptomyces finlayi]
MSTTPGVAAVPAAPAPPGRPAGLQHDFQVLFDRLRTRSFSRGGLVATVVQPLLFFAIFYCTFATMLDARGIDFGRFVTPTVLVQALMFVAIGSATDLAADRSSGVFSRLLTSPVDMRAMSLAHLAVVALQGLLSSVAVVLAGHLVGFRFDQGVLAALGFVLFAVAFTVALSLATATIALRLKNLEALSAVLHLPYLPLLVLSTGFVEADLFPGWLQPIVAASPVSGVIDALRALSSAELTWGAVLPGLAWLVGLVALFSWTTTTAFRKVAVR